MVYKDAPIQHKLMVVILLTASLALVVSCTGFIIFEISTLKNNIARALATRSEILAANIRTTLELKHPADATEVLNALKKDPRMVSACLYDSNGRIFARYPANAPDSLFPKSPDQFNPDFGPSFLTVCSPVIKDGQTLGTVYIKSNFSALTDRYPGYAVLTLVVFMASLLAAYLLSKFLQRQISLPIQSLAEAARIVSNQRDYSIRATKYGKDELGLLTDTFNEMLARIQEQNRVLLQFAAIVESSEDAIISKSTEGIITSWNPGAEKLFGYSAEEAIGRPMQMLIPQDRASEEPQILARIARGEFIEHLETVRVRKDGTLVNIAASISPIKDAHGKVVSISKIARSITERKRAEEKIHRLNAELEQRVVERTAQLEAVNAELRHSRAELNSLFESLPGLYLVLTLDLKIVAVSDAYLKATMTTRAGILHRELFEVFPDNPDDANANGVSNLRASLERVKQNGTPETMAIQKYDVRRPDGIFEEHYWSPINSPVFGADHQIKYIVHRVEEVTEFVLRKAQPAGNDPGLNVLVQRMEAEIFQSSQKLQTANCQLEAANKELEAFSYSVSHDLRAPLRAVDGFSQAVEEDYGPQLPAEGRRYLRTIRKEAQRMGVLIDDLLTFSRLSRQSMNQQEINLGKLVRDVLEELNSRTPGRQVDIQVGELPFCQGDTALIKQVWVNLLSNALKYTSKCDAAVVEIGCRFEAGEGIYFVRDNGAGFDMQYAHKLFGVFQRLHRADEFEGTGVGLAIVQRIIHRHGGRIWAESELNKGTTFYFTLNKKTP